MRVGLRSLPFRRAPLIPSYVAGESVFTFDATTPGVTGQEAPTDERRFTFDGGDPKVFGEPAPSDERVWTFDDGSVTDPGTLTTVQLSIDLSGCMHQDSFVRSLAYNALVINTTTHTSYRYSAYSGRALGEAVAPGDFTSATSYGRLAPGEVFCVIPEWDDAPAEFPNLAAIDWSSIRGVATSDPAIQVSVGVVNHPCGVRVTRPKVRLRRTYSQVETGSRWRNTSPALLENCPSYNGYPLDVSSTEKLIQSFIIRTGNELNAEFWLGVKAMEHIPDVNPEVTQAHPAGASVGDYSACSVSSSGVVFDITAWRHPKLRGEVTLSAMGHSKTFSPAAVTGDSIKTAQLAGEIEDYFNSFPEILGAGGVHLAVFEVYPDGGFKIKYR